MLALNFLPQTTRSMNGVISAEFIFRAGERTRCDATICVCGVLERNFLSDLFANCSEISLSYDAGEAIGESSCIAALENELRSRLSLPFARDKEYWKDDIPSEYAGGGEVIRTVWLYVDGAEEKVVPDLNRFPYFRIAVALRREPRGVALLVHGQDAGFQANSIVWFNAVLTEKVEVRFLLAP